MTTIALGIIVYNGASNINNLLAQLVSYVDEIIVVDSYSTDNTVEIAELYGAKVFQMTFENSFSTLRNKILCETTCDYAILLDCDEILENPDDIFNTEFINFVYGFKRKNYIDNELQLDIYPDIQYRVMKINDTNKFQNHVHELPIDYEDAIILNTDILHYKTQDEYDFANKRYSILIEEALMNNNVAYCTLTEDLKSAIPNLKTTREYVDESIVIFEYGLESDIKKLEALNITCIQKVWEDNFSKYRNYYITAARELGCGWIFTSDTDEYPSTSLCINIKDLIKSADNYDSVSFNSHDIGFDKNDIEIYHNISSYYKQLLFKIYDGVKYNRNVHHELVGHSYKEIHASKDLYYEHVKKESDIYIRGCRNFFIAGGGVDEYCNQWKELRAIESCPNSWHEFRDQLVSGTISNDVKSWIINYRNINTLPHRDAEIRAFFTTYYEILHPKQNIDNLTCKPEETVIIVNINQTFVEEEYLRVLGRHGDPAGVKLYADMLTDGKLIKNDIEFIFKNSQEYISKNPSKDITQAPFCSEAELKADIAEFTNIDIDIVNTHWTTGYEDTLKSWKEVKPDTNNEIEDWYSNTNAYIYDLAIFHRREVGKEVSFYEGITLPAIEFAHGKNLKVLDFGGGIGTMCFWLVKEGHDVSYYDLNSVTSDFAKFRNTKHNMPIKFYSETNLPTDTYDFITMVDVVEHLIDIPETLERVANLINSGGTLFITWTFPQNENDKENSPFHLDKYYRWGEVEMTRILNDVGFTRQTDNLWRKI